MPATPDDPGEPVRPPAPQIRVGDAERNAAIEALGVHMSAGRLDIDEYGERTAKVTVARTTSDLRALFDDLPAPHPKLPLVTPPQEIQRPPDTRIVVDSSDTRTPAQRFAAVAVPVAAIIAVALFFLLKTWVVFLLPALVAVIAGAMSGSRPPPRGRDGRDG